MKKLILALLATSFMGSAHATPLRMDYTTTALGGGTYHYDFTLTLDNHDSSWAAGNTWDWINFGDTDFDASTYVGFDIDGSGGVSADWTTLSAPSGFSIGGPSGGGHNGPYLQFGSSVLLPGWMPTFVGESISWSGTSGVFIPSGDLYWSSLVTGGGASTVMFEQANQAPIAAPEPPLLALIGAGLIGIGLSKRKKLK